MFEVENERDANFEMVGVIQEIEGVPAREFHSNEIRILVTMGTAVGYDES